MNDESQILSEIFNDSFSSQVKVNIAILIITGTLNIILFKVAIESFNFKDGLFLSMLIAIGQCLNLFVFGFRLLWKGNHKSHFSKYKNRASTRGKVGYLYEHF
jgi:hypothetical protein